MNLEEATFWVALSSLVVGLVATLATIVYGEIGRRQQDSHHEEQRSLAEEQLQLAREQADMRPSLEVECWVERQGYQGGGSIQVEVSNSGKVAARNVRGWIYFHEDFFGPTTPPANFTLSPAALAHSAGRSWATIFGYDAEPNKAGWYSAHIYEKEEISVSSLRTFSIDVTLKNSGVTPVRCKVVSNEGATFEGTFEVKVPGVS
jgi:hypothetical protein